MLSQMRDTRHRGGRSGVRNNAGSILNCGSGGGEGRGAADTPWLPPRSQLQGSGSSVPPPNLGVPEQTPLPPQSSAPPRTVGTLQDSSVLPP
jgi:hypothetical protein